MKKYILISMLCMLLAACKKELKQQPQTPVTEKQYSVSFAVSGLSSTIVPIKGNSKIKVNDVAPTALPFKYLYYKLYKNLNEASFHSFVQTVSAPNFGSFNDSIPAGQYTVTIVGANLPLPFFFPVDTAFHVSASVSVPDRDMFYKQYTLNVTGSLPPQNIVLDRITAQVEVNIEDAIPANVASISISYEDFYSTSMVRNGAPFPWTITPLDSPSGTRDLGTITQNVTAAEVGTTNYKIRGFIDNTVTPVTITIKAGSVTRIIPNIQFKRNTKTILTGKLFSAAASSFSVSYNTVLSTDTIKVGL